MYAPPADRTSPLMAQLARLQGSRPEAADRYQAELAVARNTVAHYTPAAKAQPRGMGLARKRYLHAGG